MKPTFSIPDGELADLVVVDDDSGHDKITIEIDENALVIRPDQAEPIDPQVFADARSVVLPGWPSWFALRALAALMPTGKKVHITFGCMFSAASRREAEAADPPPPPHEPHRPSTPVPDATGRPATPEAPATNLKECAAGPLHRQSSRECLQSMLAAIEALETKLEPLQRQLALLRQLETLARATARS